MSPPAPLRAYGCNRAPGSTPVGGHQVCGPVRACGRRRAPGSVLGWAGLALFLGLLLALVLGGPAQAAVPTLNERGALLVGGEPKCMLAWPGHDRLFVSDFSGNDVAEVDLISGLVVRRFPVPDGPVGLARSADGRWLYVAAYLGDKVYRFDLADGHLDATLADVSAPWDLKLVPGPAGRLLLAVTEHHADKVSFFDAVSLVPVSSLPTTYYPYQMDVDPGRHRLYVAAYGGKNGGELLAVDLGTLAPVWTRPTGQGSFDVKVDGVQDRVVVSDFVGNSLTVFQSDGTKIGGWKVVGGPKEGTFSPDGAGYFAAIQTLGAVVSLDPTSGLRANTTNVGSRPGPVAWVGTGSTPVLAVGNQGDGTISLLSVGDPVPEFKDVPLDDRFHRDIRVLALRGALDGYPNGDGSYSFRPDDTLTRAQIAKVLVASLGLHTAAVEPAFIDFTDVPAGTGAYPFDYVEEAARKGIVSGLSVQPPRFGPYDSVTRIQLIRMAVRAAQAVGSPLPAPAGGSPFVDVAASSPDFPVIMAAYAAGLVSGSPGPDGGLRLHPYDLATRGQTAHVVCGLLAALHRSPAG